MNENMQREYAIFFDTEDAARASELGVALMKELRSRISNTAFEADNEEAPDISVELVPFVTDGVSVILAKYINDPKRAAKKGLVFFNPRSSFNAAAMTQSIACFFTSNIIYIDAKGPETKSVIKYEKTHFLRDTDVSFLGNAIVNLVATWNLPRKSVDELASTPAD